LLLLTQQNLMLAATIGNTGRRSRPDEKPVAGAGYDHWLPDGLRARLGAIGHYLTDMAPAMSGKIAHKFGQWFSADAKNVNGRDIDSKKPTVIPGTVTELTPYDATRNPKIISVEIIAPGVRAHDTMAVVRGQNFDANSYVTLNGKRVQTIRRDSEEMVVVLPIDPSAASNFAPDVLQILNPNGHSDRTVIVPISSREDIPAGLSGDPLLDDRSHGESSDLYGAKINRENGAFVQEGRASGFFKANKTSLPSNLELINRFLKNDGKSADVSGERESLSAAFWQNG